jgi:hypothetical protein
MKIFNLFILLFTSFIYGQVDLNYYLDLNHPYNDKIPKPKDLLGFEVGQWHISHDKLVNYIYKIAELSDRIKVENRGETYEGRPVLLLKITSPENHKKLELIRKNHIKLTEINSEKINLTNSPLVVYQGFSIHGNEPSGANSSILSIYHLAASESEETLKMLNDLIILFDPSFNPDGLQRFAYWVNTNKNMILNPDPNDREYNEIWPRGRTNHYWFDLNRDWLPAQHPETIARLKTYNEWLPNILTDHHEMGTNSTFFFQPGIPERVNPLTPIENQKITKKIGEFHSEALNKIGSLYYSEEDYDDFYYGKGSTYPDINGGIGILFEQASSRGHIQESDNGILTFPFTIKNQLTATFSTLEAAVKMRIEILKYFRNFFNNVRAENKNEKNKTIVFGNPKDISSTINLVKTLQNHNIKVHQLKNSISKNGVVFNKNKSFVIPLEQKKAKLIKAIFNTQTEFKDSLFYDISGWTFPYAYNLNFTYENSSLNLGQSITNMSEYLNGSVDRKSNYAYLFEAHDYFSPKLLNLLLENNIRVKVSLAAFKINEKKYDYGTYLIPVQNQSIDDNNLYKKLKQFSKSTNIKIHGLNTGLSEGIDLGSRKFKTINNIKIGLLVGPGVRSSDAGEIWHLLDTRYNIKVTKLDVRIIDKIELNKYSHLIIPSYSGDGLNYNIQKIKDFINKGGVLIGYRDTVEWLNKNNFINVNFLSNDLESKNINFDQKNKLLGAQEIGGAIFNTKIDRSHPINFGIYSSNLPMFRNTEIFIKANDTSYKNPIIYKSNPLLSGYISNKNLKLLKNSVPLQIFNYGKGKIIALTDNTNFRAFWYGTNRILTNAIFLSNEM